MAKKKPERSGGVNISTSRGNVSIGGDVVGGDKITTTVNEGVEAGALGELVRQFQQIQKQIDALPGKDQADKQELKDTVKKIEDETKKGDKAKAERVERWLMNIGAMSDDIFKVTVATLANPVLGVVKTLQLIAQKAKEEKAKLDAKK